jgi:hypothetical protein
MGLQDLQGRRTGRPRGAKSRSRWRRDAEWVYRNLGNPDVEPPSEFARLLLALGRQHPDRLLACLAALDAQVPKTEQPQQSAEGARPVGPGGTTGWFPEGNDSRRLKQVTVFEGLLLAFLRSGTAGWACDAPFDARVVGCAADASRRAIRLFIRSVTFPEVAEGEPIPDLELIPPSGCTAGPAR